MAPAFLFAHLFVQSRPRHKPTPKHECRNLHNMPVHYAILCTRIGNLLKMCYFRLTAARRKS